MTDAQVEAFLTELGVPAEVRASLCAHAAADGFDLSVTVATALEAWERTPPRTSTGAAPSGYVLSRKATS